MLRQALARPGPLVIEAVVDPNEPPLPGNITAEQALHFAEAIAKGPKDGWKIVKTVLEDGPRRQSPRSGLTKNRWRVANSC